MTLNVRSMELDEANIALQYNDHKCAFDMESDLLDVFTLSLSYLFVIFSHWSLSLYVTQS